MPAISTGANVGNGVTAAAFEQGSTWNTAVAVGAGDGFKLLSESVVGGAIALPRESVGLQWGDVVDRGAEDHAGAIRGNLYYGGNCGKLLSYFFGTSGSPTQTPPSTGTSYLHAVTLEDALDVFMTLCMGKRPGQKWWEYASAMVAELRLRGEGNGRVTFELSLIASTLDRDSSTNTTTQTDAVTVAAIEGAVRFPEGLFRINAQGGSGLASPTDDIDIASFELVARRDLSRDFLADGTAVVAQPAEQGPCEVMLTVSTRSYDAETWKAAWAAGTEYKWDLKFTGTGLDGGSGADPYYLFQSPRAVVAEDPQASIGSRNRITHTITFKSIKAASAPTGMSGITQPLAMSVMDKVSGAYLS